MNQNVGQIIKVEGIDGNIAFNPFPLGDGIVACRIEDPESDWLNRVHNRPGPYNPHSRFFREAGNTLVPLEGAPVFELEDPFGAWVLDEHGQPQLLFGGVRVNFEAEGGPRIRTELYVAPDIYSLAQAQRPVAVVDDMRDIRFAQSEAGDLVMLPRLTTGAAYPGSISYARITFAELKDPQQFNDKIAQSILLRFSLPAGIRLGANAVYSEPLRLDSGETKELFRIVCHSSEADPYTDTHGKLVENDFVSGIIHYRAYDGYLDPESPTAVIQLRELARSSNFPTVPGSIKGPRYEDVVFPGGIAGNTLYAGLGDRSVVRIEITAASRPNFRFS